MTTNWIFIPLVTVVILWSAAQFMVHEHHLGFLPEAMGVSRIVYLNENHRHFALFEENTPSIIVYEMPATVTLALNDRGLEYLQEHSQAGSCSKGRYSEWLLTPVVLDDSWPAKGAYAYEGPWQWVSPGIGDFMFRYGFPRPFDADIERMVNQALFDSGNFYAYCSYGLIILIPGIHRIVYVSHA